MILRNRLSEVQSDLVENLALRNRVIEADLNQAARAADASREANGAVYGERLK